MAGLTVMEAAQTIMLLLFLQALIERVEAVREDV